MNRSVTDVTGGILVVSNFTLLANYAHGNRPDFSPRPRPMWLSRFMKNSCRF